MVFVVGFGAIAADALPWRTTPFLCSLAATLLAPLAVLRLTSAAAIGLAALVLHVSEVAARGGSTAGGARPRSALRGDDELLARLERTASKASSAALSG